MVPALLVIDMQNDFCLPGAPFEVRGALAVVAPIGRLVDAFRAHRLPVIWVIREHVPDGSDVEITRRERFLAAGGAFIPGTRGYELVQGLSPVTGESVVRKKRWSAFHRTDLEPLLRSLNVEGVVLTGVQTPNCIRSTAFDANSLDFDVLVASDATGANDDATHQANLQDMQAIGIQVLTGQEIVDRLPDRLGRGLRDRAPEGIPTAR